MPELAEVEHARRRWDMARGEVIRAVRSANPLARVLREVGLDALAQALVGRRLDGSEARGKQMVFRAGEAWLGLHLGMSGRLAVEPAGYEPVRHDHLVLETDAGALVFHDPRGFGRVRLALGPEEPAWWSSLAPSVLGEAFTTAAVGGFLARHGRAPLKAVLLRQERFPGIGNWMADEVLWRAGLHPATPAGALDDGAVARLRRVVRKVARDAVATIGDDWGYPTSWLFTHRWEDGGRCPRCRRGLTRETVGGRTTCWCAGCQPPPRRRR